MANISDAVGTISFDPDFYQQQKSIIDNFMQEMMKTDDLISEYGIMLTNQTNEEFTFTGSGRWSLSNIIESLLVPIAFYEQKQSKAFEDFYQLLQNTQSPIEIEYKDYECGCELLTHEIVSLTARRKLTKEQTENGRLFDSNEKLSDPYDYNDYKKIELDFEEGYLLDDPHQKSEFLKQELHPWYEEQDEEFQNNHQYSTLKNEILKYIKHDSDLKNGICLWRCEEGFDAIIEDL
jgi:hypothetical protein